MNLFLTQKNESGLQSAFLIQALNSFIWGVMYIMLPMLMLERKISIESMGLIFAVLPIIFQINRIIFGIISDYAGRKNFFWLNGITNIISLITYYLAQNPLGFLIGKTSEAIKEASIWSVNRAYLLDHNSQENDEKALVNLRSIVYITYAIGILIAGFLITRLLYGKTLILLMVLSLLIFPNLNKLIDKNKKELSVLSIINFLNFSNKSKKFKKFFWLFFISGFYYGLSSGYIFPLFLKEANLTIENIGLVIGIQTLLGGLAIHLFRSYGKGKDKLLIGGLLSSLGLILISFAPHNYLFLVFILTGIFMGLSDVGGETIFIEAADEQSLAGDIGILMIGINVGTSLTQAVSGFIISSFGFPVLFLGAAIFNLIFTVIAFRNMK